MDPFELVEAMRQALERRDADRLAALLHPDVELHLYSQPGAISGREAAHAWYRQAFESRTVFEGEAAPEPAEDGALIARGRIRWYDGGVLRDWPGKWRITFRDGLIASITAERDAARDSNPPGGAGASGN
jgi:ketosteroid isomerase-like protein